MESSEPLNLRAMGFCGVDDSVSQEFLMLLSRAYPFIEWGILFRSDLEGTPRYASWKWTSDLCNLNVSRAASVGSREGFSKLPLRLAAHLCGSRCQEILDGNSDFVKVLSEMGFGRVQVNATKANNVTIDPNGIASTIENIRKSMTAVPAIEWILQYNNETKCLCDSFLSDPHPNMSILYDSSCGLGIQMRDFPTPVLPDIRYGYAGGIGPKNIKDMLTSIRSASEGKAVWIDMESSLRMNIIDESGEVQDVFSVDKCLSCARTGADYFGLPFIH